MASRACCCIYTGSRARILWEPRIAFERHASAAASFHSSLRSDLTVASGPHDDDSRFRFGLQITLLITVVLVILVIFVFLRTLWATLIPAIAVPRVAGRNFRSDVSARIFGR